jgi:hypothetical protein
LLIILTTGSAALITYDLSPSFIVKYPIKSAIIQPFLSYIGFVFWPCLISLGYITYVESKNKKTITQLKNIIEEHKKVSETLSENIKELFNGFLYKFSTTQLQFSTTERVTLYVHDGNDTFIPFGRYSSNPEFAKKGRHEYPDSIGCVAKGWTDQWHFYKSANCPMKNEDKYIVEQEKKYSLDKGTVRLLKMKSSLLCVLRLDVGCEPIAIIVVESINPNKYEEDELKNSLLTQQAYLAEMIFRLKKYIPKPSNAKRIEKL